MDLNIYKKLNFSKKLPREPEVRNNLIYDATFYRSTCYQDYAGEAMIRQHIPHFPKSNFSEDCLYLNIFAPNVSKQFNLPCK